MQNLPAAAAKTLSRWHGTLILSEHLSIMHLGTERNQERRIYRLVPALCHLLYPQADALVAVSEDVRRSVREDARVVSSVLPIRVIANAVDVADIKSRSREQVDHPWLNDDRSLLIVSVGSLTRRKNHHILLEAVASLRSATDARLLILGEGPERSVLESTVDRLRLSDAVCMPGFVSNPAPYLAAADVFVLASRAEGWPLAVTEAMAVGCPVVATRVGGVPDLLQQGRAGALFSDGEVQELRDSVSRVLTDDEYRQQLVLSASSKLPTFAPDVIAAEWLDLMDDASVTHDIARRDDG